MATDRIQLQNLRSADILSGASANPSIAKYFDDVNSPKLPSSETLEFGEIALNIAEGYEVVAIKNNKEEIIYLPFNLAEKVYNQEIKIEDVKDEIITDLNDFKFETGKNFEDVITLVNDIELKNLKDVDDSISGENVILYKEGNTWKSQEIKKASPTQFGAIKIGEGLEAEDGVVSVKNFHIEQELVADSSNAISSSAVTKAVSSLKDDVSKVGVGYETLSADTRQTLNEISAITKTMSDKLEVNDLVIAADFAKIKTEIGLNDNGEYIPSSEALQGKTITEAIDYLNDNGDYIYERCETKFDGVAGDLADNELATAGTLTKLNQTLGFNNNAQFVPDNEVLQGRSVSDALDYLYNYSQESVNATEATRVALSGQVETILSYLASEGSGGMVKTVKYEELVNLRNLGYLKSGMWYKITNYQVTLNDAIDYAQTREPAEGIGINANNGFYLLVKAVSNTELSEVANAILSDEDTFKTCVVPSWEIKYCIDNDETRFDWANPLGYGVIYYMKDNWGNVAPYDFKNILFNHKYTFNASGETSSDISLSGNARDNIIKPAYNESGIMTLNRIVFQSDNAVGNTLGSECKEITLLGNQIGNYFSSRCNGLTLSGMTNTFIGFDSIGELENLTDSEIVEIWNKED